MQNICVLGDSGLESGHSFFQKKYRHRTSTRLPDTLLTKQSNTQESEDGDGDDIGKENCQNSDCGK